MVVFVSWSGAQAGDELDKFESLIASRLLLYRTVRGDSEGRRLNPSRESFPLKGGSRAAPALETGPLEIGLESRVARGPAKSQQISQGGQLGVLIVALVVEAALVGLASFGCPCSSFHRHCGRHRNWKGLRLR